MWMKNKLQKLLGVIALAYRFLKNIIFFGNITKYLVSGQFKKTEKTSRIGDLLYNITYKKNMDELVLVINKLKKNYGNLNIINSKLILDYDNGARKTWIITTDDTVYFVRKIDGKIFASVAKKNEFDYQIEYIENDLGKLYVNGITTPITFDTYLSGNTRTFDMYLNKLKEK